MNFSWQRFSQIQHDFYSTSGSNDSSYMKFKSQSWACLLRYLSCCSDWPVESAIDSPLTQSLSKNFSKILSFPNLDLRWLHRWMGNVKYIPCHEYVNLVCQVTQDEEKIKNKFIAFIFHLMLSAVYVIRDCQQVSGE